MAEARRWDGDHRRGLNFGREDCSGRALASGHVGVDRSQWGVGVEEDRNWVDGPLLTSASLVHQEARSSAESE